MIECSTLYIFQGIFLKTFVEDELTCQNFIMILSTLKTIRFFLATRNFSFNCVVVFIRGGSSFTYHLCFQTKLYLDFA